MKTKQKTETKTKRALEPRGWLRAARVVRTGNI